MSPDRFARGLGRLWDDFPRSPHPRDRCLTRLLREVPGMASENKLMLLHFAASLLPLTEAYVEVGAWYGLSIIAAASANERSSFIAIDDFSQFGGTRLRLEQNLKRFDVSDRVAVVETGCAELLRSRSPFGQRPVGVFFYDGDHSYKAQFRALRGIEPHLADRALIIIDDTSSGVVRQATAEFARFRPEWRLLLDILSDRDRDPVWWNGIQVFAYHRRRGRQGSNLRAALQRRLGRL